MLALVIILGAALLVIGCLYFGELFMGLEELTRRSKQMDNDEFDYGHDVTYTEDEE